MSVEKRQIPAHIALEPGSFPPVDLYTKRHFPPDHSVHFYTPPDLSTDGGGSGRTGHSEKSPTGRRKRINPLLPAEESFSTASCPQEWDPRFIEHLELNRPALMQLMVGFVGHRLGLAVAEELVQDVQLQALRSYTENTLDMTQDLKPWLFEVARNKARDALRKRQPLLISDMTQEDKDGNELSLLGMQPSTELQPEQALEQEEQKQKLREAIQTLPADMKAVVTLRYQTDLTYAEIAQRLHISESAARTNFLRGKKLLREALHTYKEI